MLCVSAGSSDVTFSLMYYAFEEGSAVYTDVATAVVLGFA